MIDPPLDYLQSLPCRRGLEAQILSDDHHSHLEETHPAVMDDRGAADPVRTVAVMAAILPDGTGRRPVAVARCIPRRRHMPRPPSGLCEAGLDAVPAHDKIDFIVTEKGTGDGVARKA